MGYKIKGSFTVEAAFIMPVILGIIMMFIYAAIFSHDRCAIEYVATMAAEDAVSANECSDELIERDITKRLDEILILDWDRDISVYTDENHVDVEIIALSQYFNRASTYNIRANKHFLPNY